jgi:hypothetical protein
MDIKIFRRFAKIEACAISLLLIFATLIALCVTLLVVFSVGITGGKFEISDVLVITAFVWTSVAMNGVLPTMLVGVPTYLLLSCIQLPWRLPLLLAITTSIGVAHVLHPLIERCSASIVAREVILKELNADEAATLNTPATLTDSNNFCPVYFEYKKDGGHVKASARFDFIHGIKIFRESESVEK